MKTLCIAVFAFLSLLFAGCASHVEPVEEKTDFKYKHTYEFMWTQAVAELKERWQIESEDKDLKEIKTKWRTQLHPMASFGERRRITVYVEGDEVNGIAVRAKEEAEQNTEEKNPSAEEDASWEPMQSDGALARRFLTDLYARLHPPQPQKEQEVR